MTPHNTAEPAPRAPLLLCGAAELDLRKTFLCGQCFRWRETSPGVWRGVAAKRAVEVCETGGGIALRPLTACGDGYGDDEAFWRDYFDLGRDYAAAALDIAKHGEYMAACVDFGRGIRILRQEPWEALCSFIVSQCNNIPRIAAIIDRLCELYGEALSDVSPPDADGCVTPADSAPMYAFPAAEVIARLDVSELAPLRCGYRAPYIIAAARAVASGECELCLLAATTGDAAIRELRRLPGVGLKVASCAALYGLGHRDGFPVDTWMRRALRDNLPPDFDPSVFGENAGLAQQYIFYNTRERRK